jgi:peptide subunit release factor RF-3
MIPEILSGDTLTEGENMSFKGIPSFSPAFQIHQ